MKINEYIESATSKIYNRKNKSNVELELADHMLKRKEFNEEIGYDADRAEEMAVEKMGDSEDIAKKFAALHNDFYNPIPDIIIYLFLSALLGTAYYLLSKYTFEEKGTAFLSIGSIFIAASIFMTASAVTLKRCRLPLIICNTLFAGVAGTYIYKITEFVSTAFSNDIQKVKDYVLNFQMQTANSLQDNTIVLTAAAVFASIAVIVTLTAVINYIKVITYSNSLLDNRIRRFVTSACAVLGAALLIFGGFLSARYISAKEHWRQEYTDNYIAFIDLCESCSSYDDVIKYIEQNNLGYTCEEFNEEPIGCYYMNNTVSIDIDFVEDNSFSAVFALSDVQFFKSIDSPTLREYRTKEDELDEIIQFDMDVHTNEENIEFLKTHIPNSIAYSNHDYFENCKNYSLKYVTGYEKYKYQTHIYVNIYPQEYVDSRNKLNSEADRIAQIVKANRNAQLEEIAKLTDSELLEPEITYEQYKRALSYLGTYFDPIIDTLDKAYYSNYIFKTNDEFSFALNSERTYIIFTDEISDIYSYIVIGDEFKYSSSEPAEPFKKVIVTNEGYYAKNGLRYDYDRLPYFEENGTRYMYYTTNEDPGDGSGYIKHYFLVNQKGDIYEDYMCYVNSDGYLYFDTSRSLKQQEDKITYKDQAGNTYTRAFETSWDENGNLLDYNKYLDK